MIFFSFANWIHRMGKRRRKNYCKIWKIWRFTFKSKW